MNKRYVVVCIIVVVLVIMALLIWWYFFLAQYTTISYQDSVKTLVNPDRGFYKQLDSNEISRIDSMETDITLILLAYDIADFKTEELSSEKLEELKAFLDSAKKHRKSVIFRAAYGFDKSASHNDAMSTEQIAIHIEQMAPLLNAYKDTILCVQAGLLGPWGEWHSSRLLTDQTEDEQIAVRNFVLLTWLENLDESIAVNLRRPSFIRDAADAGIDITRVSLHNDGLLASDTDLGTFEDGMREQDGDWFEKHVKNGINGGEMPQVSDWTVPEVAVEEFVRWRISYLNAFYNKKVLETWSNQEYYGENALSYIQNHLGYRYFVSSLTYPSKLPMNAQTIDLTITISNSGNAPARNGYSLKWFVVKEGEVLAEGDILEDLAVVVTKQEAKFTVPILPEMQDTWKLVLMAKGHGNQIIFANGGELLKATWDKRCTISPYEK